MSRILIALLFFALWSSPLAARAQYALYRTSGNAVGLAVHSHGVFGSNLIDRCPSCEYPQGSECEHLAIAGLWVGAITETGDTLVTTACDATELADTPREMGFTAAGGITVRSTLINHPHYDSHALSEEDVLCTYHDTLATTQTHEPLMIRVDQTILQYSFEPFDALLLIHFVIKNLHPTRTLIDPYVGLFAECASGWRGSHEEWPPTEWFGVQDIGFDESLGLVTEHHYTSENGNCPMWIGYQLCPSHPENPPEAHITFNWWERDPGGLLPGTPRGDAERYLSLSNGEIDPTAGSEAPAHDAVTLLSYGPLGDEPWGEGHWALAPGDSISVTFTICGGRPDPLHERTAEEDLLYHAQFAEDMFCGIHAPPTLALGVLQNPYLSQHLDIYLHMGATSDWFADVSGLQVNSTAVDLTWIGPTEKLWRANYTLTTAIDSLILVASATYGFGDVTMLTRSFAPTYLEVGQGGQAASLDGGAVLHVPAGGLVCDGYILVEALDKPNNYELGPPGILSHTGAVLEILCAGDPQDLVIAHADGEALPTLVDFESRTLMAPVASLGTFHLRPGKAHRIDPGHLQLAVPTPNPFVWDTKIQFELRARQRVVASIFDATGRSIAHLMDRPAGPGWQALVWNGRRDDGTRAQGGTYFYRIATRDRVATGKLFLVR